MKVFLILSFALVASSYTIRDDFTKEWEAYKTKYNKNYTPEEEAEHFQIFKNNLVKFAAHNKLYAEGKSTYTQGINRFADFKEEDVIQILKQGSFKPLKEFSAGGRYKTFNKTEGIVLPESIDWRDHGVVTRVKDQAPKKCGACWTFTISGTVEGQYALKTGKLVELSEQNLIDCNTANFGCGGGYADKAYDYVKEYGLESEKDYPYEARNGTCRYDPSKVVTKISDYVIIPENDEAAIQEAVATIGPIGIGIDFSMDTDFLFYKSGIYDGFCSKVKETHATLIVGYGNENGQDFYVIKNSMGEDWGDLGYYKIQRNVGDKSCIVPFGGLYPIL